MQLVLTTWNIILLAAALYYFNSYVLNHSQAAFAFKINSNNWININYELNLKINSLSYLFVLLVSIIGTATNIYILNYFKSEERCEEFILLINWFMFSMIFLVISNNLFSIIIGWELIGLTSFLLINFWRYKTTTLGCSFKAFTFNKISDIFLMIGFCILWNTFKTGNVDTILTLINLNPNNVQNVYYAAICILISSSIKSAQFIGHLWLPDSMEAPVPASSLIHSATLVSAGIYLLLKFQPLFIHTGLMNTVFFIGAFTACYGGITAASQTDMKKLLAFSTISHCGFIFASISLNNYILTIVYLYLHGLFKAATFFCAGSIIKYNGTQDTRLMGMNKNQLLNIVTLCVSSINLGGLPFTFGYLYKYLFLQFLIISPVNMISYGLIIIGMLCSIVYVYKIIYYSCFDFRKGPYQVIVYLMQNNLNYLQNKYLYHSVAKLVSFWILYIFAVFLYILVKYYFLKHYFFFYHTNTVQVNDYMFLTDLFVVKSYLIKIYYTLFITVIVCLILVNPRTNYFYDEKMNLIVLCLGFLVFYSIYTKLIMLSPVLYTKAANLNLFMFLNFKL